MTREDGNGSSFTNILFVVPDIWWSTYIQ